MKSRNILIILLLSLIFSVTSCVTSKKVTYLQSSYDTISYKEMLTPDDYRVQVLDELYVRVTTLDEDMSKLFNLTSGRAAITTVAPGYNSYTISDEGTISFPYIGNIYVLNKTTREIKSVITDTLSSMLKDFSVEVRLMNSYFSILTDKGSGRYPITKERLNIFQALALSGDLHDFADRKHVKVIRQTPKGTVVRIFDVRKEDIVDSEFYYIQPNDVIYVQSFKGQYFGISSFTALFSVISSVASLTLIFIKFGKVF